jgi:hypothetical protein
MLCGGYNWVGVGWVFAAEAESKLFNVLVCGVLLQVPAASGPGITGSVFAGQPLHACLMLCLLRRPCTT